MSGSDIFFRIAAALAARLPIGLERGWQDRDAQSGSRVAGIRTFALIVRALRAWFGDTGIYVVAAFSGLTGVDTVTLSISRFASEDSPINVAARALVVAGIVSTVFKTMLAAFIARGKMARLVGVPLSLTAATGLGAASV